MRFGIWLASTAAIAATITLTAERRADACGGCFAPTDTVTTVDSHRMVVSLSPQRSILWDQISYSGDPKDFVWVLPVPSADTTIEVAPFEMFDEIEFQTSPIVQPRPASPPNRGCFGCCASAMSEGVAGGADAGSVVIYNDEVVGPYQTVTIGSEDANALQDWLVQNGYRVVESTVPTIEHYVDQGNVFIVLRLAPGEGVSSMQPVRIEYPGYLATFPLEMVKIGAASTLDLSLWVIAEQRVEANNYGNVRIDRDHLVFDWDTQSSNYAEAFRNTIDDAGGRVWVTEFAAPLSRLWFSSPAEQEIGLVRQDLPQPYITRLRTSMLVEYLTEDLILANAVDATEVSRFIEPGDEINRPFEDKGGCRAEGNAGGNALFLVLMLAAVQQSLQWRRRRR